VWDLLCKGLFRFRMWSIVGIVDTCPAGEMLEAFQMCDVEYGASSVE
jgi:hypothetical protein